MRGSPLERFVLFLLKIKWKNIQLEHFPTTNSNIKIPTKLRIGVNIRSWGYFQNKNLIGRNTPEMLGHIWNDRVLFSTHIPIRTINTLLLDQLIIFKNVTIILYEKIINFSLPSFHIDFHTFSTSLRAICRRKWKWALHWWSGGVTFQQY